MKPICFWCLSKTAKILPMFLDGEEVPVLCSMQCLKDFAQDTLSQSKFAYCVVHEEWSDHTGKCERCARVPKPTPLFDCLN